MAGLMSRNKGKRGEREVIVLMQPVVDEVYGLHQLESPQLKRNTLQSDGGGSDIAGLPWLAVEVMYCQTFSIGRWWRQALEQAGGEREPVLLYRRNNAPWSVMMYGMLGGMGLGYQVPVIVGIEPFLAWFRLRLNQELEG